jgi:hypothetical protein
LKLPLRCCRWTLRLAGIFLLLLLSLIVYLNWVGFPDALTQRWLRDLRAHGYFIEIDGLKFDIMKGITATGVRLYENAEAKVPLLESERLSVSMRWINHLRNRPAPLRLRIEDGSLRLNADNDLQERTARRNLALEHIQARVRIFSRGIQIDRIKGEFLGVHINGQGFIAASERAAEQPMEHPMTTLQHVMAKRPAWLPRMVEQLNAVRFESAPQAEVDFHINPVRMSETEVNLSVTGGVTEARGVRLDGWLYNAGLRGTKLSIPAMKMWQNDRQVSLTAVYDLSTRIVLARFFSNLPSAQWLKIFPMAWNDQLLQQGIVMENPFSCEFRVGPAPINEVLEHMSGWFALEQANLRGVWVEKAFIAFRRECNTVTVQKVEAVLGKGVQQGPVTGRGTLDFETQKFSGHVQLNFDPNVLVPIFNARQADVVKWFGFPAHPPSGEFDFSGRIGHMTEFAVNGQAWASNFTCNGAQVSFFRSPIAISNSVMTLEHGEVIRPEGQAFGKAVQNFDEQTVDLVVTSTVDPKAIAQMIGPVPMEFMKMFRVEGPARIVAAGKIDYGAFSKTDLRAEVDAERLGIKWCLPDRTTFDLQMVGRRIELTNFNASVYGGRFGGYGSFFPVGSDTNMRYEVTAHAEGISFAQLLKAITREKNPEKHTGELSCSLFVAGFIGEGRGKTATGSGTINIKEGHLFELRVFGELSRILSYIYPGFGSFSQTALTASYVIQDGMVITEDADLEGTVLSLRGKGTYHFNETLDFRVQVMLLRGGPVASVLRLMTFPVTKLLEFRLLGTVAEPRWRPVNLPKELFLIFD